MEWTIGGVARTAGVSVETVRYYEREGLIEQPPKPSGGHRRYPEATVGRIRFIRRAQELGFTLRQIHELIALQEAPAPDCTEVCRMAQVKIVAIDTKMRDLAKIRSALDGLIQVCGDRERGCAILDSLQS